MNELRNEIVGVNEKLPLINGEKRRYINFDNAASTPSLKRVLNKINDFMKYYSSIHRGTGFKSRLSSEMYEVAREKAGEFVDYDKDNHVVIFVKNTTEAVNKLSYRLDIPEDAIIIVSSMEHHSNDLPWRARAKVLHAPVNIKDGTLDVKGLIKMIDKHKDKLYLVSITGASNVSGNVNPYHEIAKEVHKVGAYIAVDGAQLVPHKRLKMGKVGEPESIDFAFYSAHKMYAPYGTGVLIARKDLMDTNRAPEYRGGGTVKVVTFDNVVWDDEPHIDEAGSPNVVGTIALAEAINFYNEMTYEKLDEIELNLARRLLTEFKKREEHINVLGRSNPEDLENRLGVISFYVKDIPHSLVASVLAYEYGVGVRNGCFCAHPYLKVLLEIDEQQDKKLIQEMINDNRKNIPGAIRASFGFYNIEEEIDIFIDAIDWIIKNKEKLASNYILNEKTGEYFPKNYKDNFEPYFKL